MATLQADAIADLVKSVVNDLGSFKWTDITSDLQEHVAMPKLIKKEKVYFSSGTEFEFNLQSNDGGAAAWKGLYAQDTVNTADEMIRGKLGWKNLNTNWAFDRREIAMNRDPHKVFDLIKVRRTGAMISMAAQLETGFWSKPTDANDALNPNGLKYWAVFNSSDGFTGGAAFGSTVANIDPSAYPRHKSYNATYSAVTPEDLIRKWRKAARQTNFISPVEVPNYHRGESTRYGWYTDDTTIGLLEELLLSQNDNLGNDLASKDGMTLFRRNPVTYVPKLDTLAASGSNPIYGIPWFVFEIACLRGEYMKDEGPEKVSQQHTVYQAHIDTTLNFCCKDRRRLVLLAKSDPA